MEIRDSEFDDIVLNSDRPVLVDFWASWCPPCKMMQPVVDKLAGKVADWADVCSINIDRSPALAAEYQVSGVPTFIAFADGQPVDRKTGALTEGQLISLLNSARERMPPVDSAADDSSVDTEVALTGVVLTANTGIETGTDRESDTSRPVLSTESRQFDNRPFITVVSGLPRSGTSLMMRMLNAGGIPALCDEHRTPDADNPNGYYEFEDVKSIQNYDTWIDRAPGHAVKMVYSLLKHLPSDRQYRVLFMRRHVDEILQSQRTMLEHNGIATDIPDVQLKALFERELNQFYAWLPSQSHLKLINISYNELMSRPSSTIALINRHFDDHLDTESMTRIIDPALYRHRAA